MAGRFLTMIAMLSSLTAGPTPAAQSAADGEALGFVPELLAKSPAGPDRYLIVPLSGTLVHVVFASTEDRSSLLEGVSRDDVPGLEGSVPVWIADELLAEALAGVAPGGGSVGELRDALVAAGIALPPRDGRPTAVVTTVAAPDAGELFDFSMSEMQHDLIAREESLDQLDGRSATETASLKFAGAGHPTVALFEPWRFDEMPDAIDEKDAEAAQAARIAEVRRARYEVEVVRALFHVDLFYEDAVLEWLEALDQEDVNLLARLLQIAGLREISPQVLVRMGTPLLWEPSVLQANLFGALERVTRSAGRKGARRLDPDRFASDEVLERAAAFYPQFFVADRRGDLQLELVEPVGERIERWSTEIREVTLPFVERHLAGLSEVVAEP